MSFSQFTVDTNLVAWKGLVVTEIYIPYQGYLWMRAGCKSWLKPGVLNIKISYLSKRFKFVLKFCHCSLCLIVYPLWVTGTSYKVNMWSQRLSCPVDALQTLGNSSHIALAPTVWPPAVGGDVVHGLLAMTQSSPVTKSVLVIPLYSHDLHIKSSPYAKKLTCQ